MSSFDSVAVATVAATAVAVASLGLPCAAEVTGQFVASCPFSHFAYDDPIVFPDQPGASHHHMFFGNVTADASSTVPSLQVSPTTCTERPGDTAAYWTPVILAGGEITKPRSIRAYYRSEGMDGSLVQPFPEGLVMIAGDATASAAGPPQDLSVFNWACTIPGPGDEIEVADVPVCDASSPSLRFEVKFPRCWDGVQLDSADHKSHMAYASGGVCPPSHPIVMPLLTIGIRTWYGDPTFDEDGNEVGVFERTDTITLSSGDAYSGHADFINAWHPENLGELVTHCIQGGVNCGDIGDESADAQDTGKLLPRHDRLLVSDRPDRTGAVPLAGRTLPAGEHRVFVDLHDPGDLLSVEFQVDGVPIHDDPAEPYDLAPGSSPIAALPFGFTPRQGPNEIRWIARYGDGRPQRESVTLFQACPETFDPVLEDADRDGVSDLCDNCELLLNPGQSDADGNAVGDPCDTGDGELHVRFVDASTLNWDEEVGYGEWNVYRGELSQLRATGEYTQSPGAVPAAASFCGEATSSLQDPYVPPATTALYFLVTGATAGTEASLGRASSGAERTNANPCAP